MSVSEDDDYLHVLFYRFSVGGVSLQFTFVFLQLQQLQQQVKKLRKAKSSGWLLKTFSYMLQRRRHSYQHLVSIKYFSQQLQKYHTLWVFSRASSGPTTPRVSERSSSQPPVRLFSPDTSTFDPAWPPTAGRSFILKGNDLIWNYRNVSNVFLYMMSWVLI